MEAFRRKMFEQLGNLFYAIPAEQRVPMIASGELKMAIKRDWLSATNGDGLRGVSEGVHLIGVTIDSLLNEKIRPSEAFADFERFYQTHQEQFSHALKEQILETADRIIRVLPSSTENNACYEGIKKLLYVSMDADAG